MKQLMDFPRGCLQGCWLVGIGRFEHLKYSGLQAVLLHELGDGREEEAKQVIVATPQLAILWVEARIATLHEVR